MKGTQTAAKRLKSVDRRKFVAKKVEERLRKEIKRLKDIISNQNANVEIPVKIKDVKSVNIDENKVLRVIQKPRKKVEVKKKSKNKVIDPPVKVINPLLLNDDKNVVVFLNKVTPCKIRMRMNVPTDNEVRLNVGDIVSAFCFKGCYYFPAEIIEIKEGDENSMDKIVTLRFTGKYKHKTVVHKFPSIHIQSIHCDFSYAVRRAVEVHSMLTDEKKLNW